MTVLGPFPNAAKAVSSLLGTVSGVAASYYGPRTLQVIQSGKMPAVRVMHAGGGTSRVTRNGFADRITATSFLSVAVFAGDEDTASSLAESCRQVLTSQRGITAPGGTLIDFAETMQAPELLTPPDSALTQCVTAGYIVSMRRAAQ